MPLKTYLPDGDIDLTAFGGLNFEEALANDVCSVLEREDHNRAAEFVVKDVQLIRAEVFNFLICFSLSFDKCCFRKNTRTNDFHALMEIYAIPMKGFLQLNVIHLRSQ